ncbi:MAG TPA: GNAT family N-acetyltransferase [Rhizomicrobium sp.]|jgi:GNAT superfamily N-acetyltransferase
MSATDTQSGRAHAAAGATVRKIMRSDSAAVSQLLARAFWDDPLTSHLLADEATRGAKLPKMFGLLLNLGLPYGACFVTSGYEAATLWRPPNQWHIPFWQYVTNAPGLIGVFGSNALNVIQTMDEVEKNHPKAPHWYLQTIGTDPAKQGKGFGGAIMRQQLAVADAARMPCYLESSKDKNIPIYQSFGFKVTGEIRVPKGGPTIWPMWRDVQA